MLLLFSKNVASALLHLLPWKYSVLHRANYWQYRKHMWLVAVTLFPMDYKHECKAEISWCMYEAEIRHIFHRLQTGMYQDTLGCIASRKGKLWMNRVQCSSNENVKYLWWTRPTHKTCWSYQNIIVQLHQPTWLSWESIRLKKWQSLVQSLVRQFAVKLRKMWYGTSK